MRPAVLIQRDSTAGKGFCLVALLLTIAVNASHAQPQSVVPPKTATIRGTVTDQTGASLPGATVSLEAREGATLQTRVGEDGRFTLDAWPGEYIFKVSARAFKTVSQPISLATTTNLRQDAVLTISQDLPCGPCFTPAPLIETVSDPLIATLPLNPLPPLNLHTKHSKNSPK
jgi:Carboxypeptidase regulatory-like domain